MIDYDALTRTQREQWKDALFDEQIDMRLKVVVRDQNEKAIGSLTADGDWERARDRGEAGVIAAQVDHDLSATPTHQLSLTVIDPHGKLSFEKESPNQALLWHDHFVSVQHELWVRPIDEWVSCYVFWGCVGQYSAQGEQVEIEGLGKEIRAQEQLWKNLRLQKGLHVDDAIKKILRVYGETRFNMPSVSARLHKDITLGKHQHGWSHAKKLAHSAGFELFYDHKGRATLDRFDDAPALLLTDGPYQTL